MSSLDCNNFNKMLECPVYYTGLKDAVMLTPCGHTISELAAKAMYQGAFSTPLTQQGSCPVCRARVTAYYPNFAMRNLAELLLPALSKSDAIPAPRKAAKFVLKPGEDWSHFCEENAPKRLLFKSTDPDATFHTFGVYGDRDGKVFLGVFFSEKDRGYLSVCGILNAEFSPYLARSHTLKLLFRIIETHNEIPADQLPLIRNLVEKGKWFDIADTQTCIIL